MSTWNGWGKTVASPEQFNRRMGRLGLEIAQEADRTVRMAALAADQAVVMATPVDKGRARSNWIVQMDAPARTAIDAYVPGDKGSTAGPNSASAIAQGQAVIAGYDGDRNSGIAISNNLPYIDALNSGSSRQAPAGFVEKAVQAAVRQVKGARFLR